MSRTKASAEESATLARTIGVGSDAKAYDSITDMIADPNIHALWYVLQILQELKHLKKLPMLFHLEKVN